MFTVYGRPDFIRSFEVQLGWQDNSVLRDQGVALGVCSGRVSSNIPGRVSISYAESRHRCLEKFPCYQNEFDGSVFLDGSAGKFVRELPVWLYSIVWLVGLWQSII